MKVAHLISTIGPGGAETYVKSLAIGLAGQGMEQEIWSLSSTERIYGEAPSTQLFSSTYRNDLSLHGVTVRCLGIRDRVNLLEGAAKLTRATLLGNPDIIHVHIYWGLLYGLELQRRLPFVFTHHGGWFRLAGLHRSTFSKRLGKYIAICQSDYNTIASKLDLPSGCLSLIPNGIETAGFSCPDRSRNPGAPLRAVAVGRLCEQKNYPMMLRALRLVIDDALKQGMPAPVLDIVGDGPLRKDLEDIVDILGLRQSVSFLGIRTDVRQLLRRHDMFLMSSAWEGMPIVLLEALSSGLPVVATEVDGNTDVIAGSGAGFLVPTNDDRAMADSVLRIARDMDLWARMSRLAAERAKLFSIEEAIRKHIDAYCSTVLQTVPVFTAGDP